MFVFICVFVYVVVYVLLEAQVLRAGLAALAGPRLPVGLDLEAPHAGHQGLDLGRETLSYY